MAFFQAAIDASHPWSLNMHAICHPQFLSLALDNLGPQHRKLPAAEETTKNKRKDFADYVTSIVFGHLLQHMPATNCIILQLFLVFLHNESSHVYICPPRLREQMQWHTFGQIAWQLLQYVFMYTHIYIGRLCVS